jgi:hypothetical protein
VCDVTGVAVVLCGDSLHFHRILFQRVLTPGRESVELSDSDEAAALQQWTLSVGLLFDNLVVTTSILISSAS